MFQVGDYVNYGFYTMLKIVNKDEKHYHLKDSSGNQKKVYKSLIEEHATLINSQVDYKFETTWQQIDKKINQIAEARYGSIYTENWIKTECPHCQTNNWILMSIDYTTCICSNCKNKFWISMEILNNYKSELAMEKVFTTKGHTKEKIIEGEKKPK